MTMKKIAVFAAVLLVAAALFVGAGAADEVVGTDNQEVQSDVTYTGKFAYTFTIPTTFNFGSNTAFENDVKINIIVADSTKKVTMSVTETLSGGRVLTHGDNDATIPYVISLDSGGLTNVITQEIFSVVASQTGETPKTLYFTLRGTPTKAGIYTDTLTFTTAVTTVSGSEN